MIKNINKNRKINKNLSLGECVIIYPGIVEKFNNMQLDYCCGGNKNLEVALKEKGIDVAKFIENVNIEFDKFVANNSSYVNWNEKSSEELINHIINVHHTKTFELLNDISPLLLKVFKVHYNHLPEVLKRVNKLFGTLKFELEEHLIKEEKELFPKIIELGKIINKNEREQLIEEIQSFIEEHEVAGDIIKELDTITDGYTVPEWACTSFELLYSKLHELEKDLFIHIHKENNILFKRYK
ncbi:iron-sulfur cluster repair di-iron protein [Clostridium senegalense]|uniref:Iron-sulfur cluster repair di-iron protein n=1 Tax=Clostridium senegalense TaxID=1465809 RepID=A0A6M0H400_9CLOT|nr:iron-sulfur cluster repair di-iron protein [Clostridium senegalense]NEU05257.1 iron-sulfur cluster repair di-iron protein [Clostridium senegalense]